MTGVNTQALSRIVLGLNLRDLSEILVSLEGSICNYILLIRSLHLMHNFLYLMHVLDVLIIYVHDVFYVVRLSFLLMINGFKFNTLSCLLQI